MEGFSSSESSNEQGDRAEAWLEDVCMVQERFSEFFVRARSYVVVLDIFEGENRNGRRHNVIIRGSPDYPEVAPVLSSPSKSLGQELTALSEDLAPQRSLFELVAVAVDIVSLDYVLEKGQAHPARQAEEEVSVQQLPREVIFRIASLLNYDQVKNLGSSCSFLARTLLGLNFDSNQAWAKLTLDRFPRLMETSTYKPREQESSSTSSGKDKMLWRAIYRAQERSSELWFYETQPRTVVVQPSADDQPVSWIRRLPSEQSFLIASTDSLGVLDRQRPSSVRTSWKAVPAEPSGSGSGTTNLDVSRRTRPDGMVAATVSPASRKVKLWRRLTEPSRLRCMRTRTFQEPVEKVHLDETYAAIGCRDGSIVVASLCVLERNITFKRTHRGEVTSLNSLWESSKLFSTSSDSEAHVFDLERGREFLKFRCHDPITCAAVTKDEQLAYVASGCAVYVCDFRQRETAAVLGSSLRNHVIQCMTLRDDLLLVCGTDSGSVIAWPGNGPWEGVVLAGAGRHSPVDRAWNVGLRDIHVDNARIVGCSPGTVKVWDASLTSQDYSHVIYEAAPQKSLTSMYVDGAKQQTLFGLSDGSIEHRSFLDGRLSEDENMLHVLNHPCVQAKF
mmetsp:Transcript_18931/g.76015  ORF Transcript_18931/g.76015 Transcript_18931/m.76015 type:complete len:617 (+) Transcript_18931:241-2091(+)|eukprot:CAMPEP_0113957020 /NCGR_PEP_ID=MMETSP0011_2-20120614/2460_1 /TAXON_ID=101924 /ORGANISM="Rhodosorus marinus" /LENGTH=616 /DNA_ID=CAMNT_0000967381 /DNA_START=204 /DNA_END=2054 /DNA_ORIENTATION=+ /assembly_acc=CAM_ASM_000156